MSEVNYDLTGTKLGEVKALVDAVSKDYLAGMGGNKSAARRARKAVQELTKLRTAIREELLAAMGKKDENE